MGTKVDSVQVMLTLSPEVRDYLAAIAELGIYGKTPSEVARTFVGRELERLVVEKGLVPLKRVSKKPRARAR